MLPGIADNDDLLIVVTPSCRGTAVLIAPDLIVTAGHVVQPYQQVQTPAALIKLRATDGSLLHPTAAVVHPRWAASYSRAADMALLRLAHPLPADMVTSIVDDAHADALAVSINGFGLDGTEITNTGTVSRVAGAGGLDVFLSSDLTFPDGVSGGPILDAAQAALGIATWCPTVATPSAFIGIPFLASTLGWLRANL